MSKNTLWAIVFTLLVFMVWSYYLKKNYTPPVRTSRITFSGLQSVQPDYDGSTMKLRWNKALSQGPVSYWIYYQIDHPVQPGAQPVFSTTDTRFTVADIDLSRNYYFMVKAVDQNNQADTNQHQIFFQPRESAVKKTENLVIFENRLARYTLSSMGGRIKSILLKEFSNIHNNEKVNLIPTLEGKNLYAYPLDCVLLNQNNINVLVQNDVHPFQISRSGEKIVFTAFFDQWAMIKEYTFLTNEYYFKLKITLRHSGGSPVNADRLVLKWQPGLGPENMVDKYDKLTMAYFYPEKLNEVSIKPKQHHQWIVKKEDNIKWAAFYNRYFLSAILPEQDFRVKEAYFYSDGTKQIAGLASQIDRDLLKKNQIEFTYTIYAGPKLRDTFRQVTVFNTLERTILTQRAFIGQFINRIGNFFLDMLIFLNKLVHNFGIAIIIFSILIKAVLYPLTHKQLESMAKMQKIQPIINQVKEQFKNDPKRLNVELMRVYKKYKVNPFGGCLPMILQIPIFFAIWDMLQYSLELRNARFLWIKSLALPDTVGHFAGIAINPLPVLMGITMIFQQTQTSADPKQKAMTYLLPLIFLFFFWGMPSGLVLYWTIQNILGIFQQILIANRQKKSNTEVIA